MNTKAIDTRLKKLEAGTVEVSPEFDPAWLSEEKRKEWDRNMGIVGDIENAFDTHKILSDEKRAALRALNETMLQYYEEAGAVGGPFNVNLLSHDEAVSRLAELEAKRRT